MMKAVNKMIEKNISISSMESCTGGLFASTITDISGASAIFPGSFVTYSNAGKTRCGVDEEIINKHGVYSIEAAKAMAKACSTFYRTDIGVGITGTLGRIDPNNADSQSGIVYYAFLYEDKFYAFRLEIPKACQTRNDMKKYIVNAVLEKIDKEILSQ